MVVGCVNETADQWWAVSMTPLTAADCIVEYIGELESIFKKALTRRSDEKTRGRKSHDWVPLSDIAVCLIHRLKPFLVILSL
jgi:hypothetical protein